MAQVKFLLFLGVMTLYSLNLNKALAGDSCSLSEKNAIGLCAVASMKDWKVTNAEMSSTSRKFCCFIWYALECQVKIARGCDHEFADQLARDTEQAYRSLCAIYPRRSSKCDLNRN